MLLLWLFFARCRYIARCTIRQHYYPESGWGWVVVVTGVMVQILATGIHWAVGAWLLLEGTKRYRQPVFNVGTICKDRRSYFLISMFNCVPTASPWLNYLIKRAHSYVDIRQISVLMYNISILKFVKYKKFQNRNENLYEAVKIIRYIQIIKYTLIKHML